MAQFSVQTTYRRATLANIFPIGQRDHTTHTSSAAAVTPRATLLSSETRASVPAINAFGVVGRYKIARSRVVCSVIEHCLREFLPISAIVKRQKS